MTIGLMHLMHVDLLLCADLTVYPTERKKEDEVVKHWEGVDSSLLFSLTVISLACL